MRILVLGGDGYLGWPTALHLSRRGHDVGVVDNFVRRQYDFEMGVDSLVPIAHLQHRVKRWSEVSGLTVEAFVGDLTDHRFCETLLERFEPEAIVHFAEQRSAPYSMIDRAHAVYTQVNNVVGTLNVLYAIAEREDGAPWPPLRVRLGFPPEQSIVTVFGGEAPHNVNDHVSTTAAGILNNVSDVATTLGSNVGWYMSQSQLLVVLGPEHAATIAADGFSPSDVQRFVFEHARLPLGRLKLGGMWGMHDWPLWMQKVTDEAALLPMVPARVKEWAYAGFAINLVSALIAHLSIGDRPAALAPSATTSVLWALSYFFWRRLQASATAI